MIAVLEGPNLIPRAVFFDLLPAVAANLTDTVQIHQQRFSRACRNVPGECTESSKIEITSRPDFTRDARLSVSGELVRAMALGRRLATIENQRVIGLTGEKRTSLRF